MFDWVNRLFQKYRFMRRFVMFWIMALLTGATYQVFWNEKSGVATEYVALTGLLAVAISLYQWLREKEGE